MALNWFPLDINNYQEKNRLATHTLYPLRFYASFNTQLVCYCVSWMANMTLVLGKVAALYCPRLVGKLGWFHKYFNFQVGKLEPKYIVINWDMRNCKTLSGSGTNFTGENLYKIPESILSLRKEYGIHTGSLVLNKSNISQSACNGKNIK